MPQSSEPEVQRRAKPHKCLTCNRCFSASSGLTLHRRTHSAEKPHTCLTCSKTFITSAHLALHLRTHTVGRGGGDRRYKCSFCGKSFAHRAHLTRHKAVHTGEKPFKCPDCGKCFGRASHLKTHQRLHTGEKPFCCTICNKAFTQKAGLIVHQRRHTGERPFKCDECNKAFRTSSHLTSHRTGETGEGRKKRVCGNCSKASGISTAPRRHESNRGGTVGVNDDNAGMLSCSVCCGSLVCSSYLQVKLHLGDVGCIYHCKVCDRTFAKMSAFEQHCNKHRRRPKEGEDEGEGEDGAEEEGEAYDEVEGEEEVEDDGTDPLFLPHTATSAMQYVSEVNTRSKTRARTKMESLK